MFRFFFIIFLSCCSRHSAFSAPSAVPISENGESGSTIEELLSTLTIMLYGIKERMEETMATKSDLTTMEERMTTMEERIKSDMEERMTTMEESMTTMEERIKSDILDLKRSLHDHDSNTVAALSAVSISSNVCDTYLTAHYVV